MDRHHGRTVPPGLLLATVLAACVAALPAPLPAAGLEPPPDPAAIDRWVETRMQEERIPGVALAIVRGGEVTYLRGYGLADANDRPVTPRTPFPLGSVSKSFTGLAVAQLAEAGALDLDAPVRDPLPWFRAADAEQSAAITVRHLLTHASGFSTLDGNRHRIPASTADDALERRTRLLQGARLASAPGTRHEYSNANYQTLGALIEAVAGRPYEDYVAERIFQPLGMSAGFASTPARLPGDTAVGHRYWFGWPVAAPFLEFDRQLVAQALVVASAEDMARYLRFNLGHGVDTGAVLSRAGIDAMHDPGAFGYGFGWMVRERHGVRYIGHGGQNPGYFAFVMFSPDRDEGVAVLANAADLVGRRGAEGIAVGVVDLLAGVEPRVGPASPVGRIVMAAAVALLLLVLASMGLTRRRLRQWRHGERAMPTGRASRLLRLLPSLGCFGAAAYFFLVFVWRSFGATLYAGLQFAPDVAWLSLLAGGLALAWAPVRAALLSRAFTGK